MNNTNKEEKKHCTYNCFCPLCALCDEETHIHCGDCVMGKPQAYLPQEICYCWDTESGHTPTTDERGFCRHGFRGDTPQEDWEDSFDKQFEVWNHKQWGQVFPCEGGYCDMKPLEVKDFIRSLLAQKVVEAKQEERQFILNILDGVDIADEQMGNTGGGTKAIRMAIDCSIIKEHIYTMKEIQQAMEEKIYLDATEIARKNNQVVHDTDSKNIGSYYITLQQLERIIGQFEE